MSQSSDRFSKSEYARHSAANADKASGSRKTNRLKDEIYREMFLLESNRPGSEMGLALALLRAIVHSNSLTNCAEFKHWLNTVCPIGLHMIEAALGATSQCSSARKPESP